MARQKKPRGRKNHGPFDFASLEGAIRLDGWEYADHGNHPNYRHPEKRGKVQLDKKWTGVMKGDQIFRSIARQAELTGKELLELLNR